MSNKMYSITGFIFMLSAFHGAQGMDDRALIAELKAENAKLKEKLENKQIIKKHRSKLQPILDHMKAYRMTGHWSEGLNQVEQQREDKFVELWQSLKVDSMVDAKFQAVLFAIYTYDAYYDPAVLNPLEEKRQEVWQALREVLKSGDVEEVQGCESSIGLDEAFEELFGIEVDQNVACENLLKSIVSMESLLDQKDNKEEINTSTEVKPVTVSWGTSFWDWYYGPKNLVSELSSDKLPLDVLKKSPDMQKRINNMIASYSPSKKRNPETLQSLVDIYSALNQLNFKFVDIEVNSDIHNVCKEWLRDEEARYSATRKAAVFDIAKLLTFELNKMIKAETPCIETIMKLEQLQGYTEHSGAIEVLDEEKVADAPESRVFEIVRGLEVLSEALLEEEEFKKLFA